MKNNLITVKNISFSYNNEPIIKNITLEIKEGEFIGLIGPNGAGKTTLLNLLCGLKRIKEGEILIKEKPLSLLTKESLSRILAYLPQFYENFEYIKVYQIVLLGRIPYFRKKFFEDKEDIEEARKAMEICGILHLCNRYFYQLSGGEKQMVLIAKLIVQKTPIMLLDEPITFLDISHVIKIMNIIKKINQEKGITVIAALHDLNIAAMYCDRLVLLKKGSIISIGSPAEVLTYEKIKDAFETEFYIDINDLTGEPLVIPMSPHMNK